MPSASLSPGSPSSSFKLNLLPQKFRKSPSPPPPPPAHLHHQPQPTAMQQPGPPPPDIFIKSPTTPNPPDSPFGSAPSTSSFANFRSGAASAAAAAGPSTRSRSSSQPLRPSSSRSGAPSLSRHQSHLNFKDSLVPLSSTIVPVSAAASGSGATLASPEKKKTKGRGRSASLVTVTQVGGEEMDGADMGTLGTQNWDWLDSKGAWAIHPILILIGKFVFDSIPGIGSDLSWTLVTCGYMAVSYLIFHQMTGLPFENTMATGGAYDELTLWEQIDNGAQYTPAKKWLTSVPIGLFLISTHYTKYDPVLFSINTFALTCVLIPKLPALHRLRFHFLGGAETSAYPTPANSRPSSPMMAPSRSLRGSAEPEGTIMEE